MNITIGTDPEAFFTKKDDTSVYPARLVFDDLFGTEEYEMSEGNLIVDGAALEFQPCASLEPEEVVSNLRALMQQGLVMADKADLRVRIDPELPLDLAWCERDPQLAIFGCNPDRSAWGEECEPGTINAAEHPWRYAGCHIHIGIVDDSDHFTDEEIIIRSSRALDRTVGLASMVLSSNYDKRRRGIYGRPGIYRHQPWGMEYRTPSNMILRSPHMMQFIFKLTQQTIELIEDHYRTMMAVIPDDIVVQTLRGEDIGLASELYARMVNVFCLDRLPPLAFTSWEKLWLPQSEYATASVDYAQSEAAILNSIDSIHIQPEYGQPVPIGGPVRDMRLGEAGETLSRSEPTFASYWREAVTTFSSTTDEDDDG